MTSRGITEPVLTVAETAAADRFAMERGIAGTALMEAAGKAVAAAILRAKNQGPARVLVLCGPGNNGGDGFVVARLLRQAGWEVALQLLGDSARLKDDAAFMARRWTEDYGGTVAALGTEWPFAPDVIVDALFGAGLNRAVGPDVAEVIARANATDALRIAVDIPTGVMGDTGRAEGTVFDAHRTVTFFTRKPGHLLLPGRLHCGTVEVADIGIPDEALTAIPPRAWRNGPGLWLDHWPWPSLDGHKYRRGHAIVVSGPLGATGAACLAARGALRIGGGLVTVACPADALPVLGAKLTAVMTRALTNDGDFARLLEDARHNAVLLGPGGGVGEGLRAKVTATLRAGKRVVLDADALTSFRDRPEALFAAKGEGDLVLTPHDGEFARLFPDLAASQMGKIERAREAATRAGAVLVLKGADTVIAAPDGRIAINDNAPPELATAGTGDVLAGFILGLLAQGMPAFEAAAAAVWVHGAAAASFGPGLIAEDLPELLPAVLRSLRAR